MSKLLEGGYDLDDLTATEKPTKSTVTQIMDGFMYTKRIWRGFNLPEQICQKCEWIKSTAVAIGMTGRKEETMIDIKSLAELYKEMNEKYSE